jgi:hypothetical protein
VFYANVMQLGGRLSAQAALEHPWLDSDRVYVDVLFELETTWMRKCLARRRYVSHFVTYYKEVAWHQFEDGMAQG